MARNQLDFTRLDEGLQDVVGTGLDIASLFIPQLGESPFFSNLLTRFTGRGTTEELREVEPALRRQPTGREGFFTFRGPGGRPTRLGLPSLLEQAVGEREETFERLTELGEEQRGELAAFRTRVGEAFSGLRQADQILRQAGLASHVQLRRGLQSLAQFRQQTLGFVGAGLRYIQDRISEARAGNEEVLSTLDTDIANRIGALSAGIQQRGDAMFQQHQMALDSVSPLSPEERANLRAFYDYQIAGDVATAAGAAHESAVEFRGRIAADLQTSMTNAVSLSTQAATGMLETGVSAFQAAENIAADMRAVHTANVRQLSIARSELQQFAATFTNEASREMFNMVSEIARPVMVISDIMYDVFDTAFDIRAFNNQVEQLELANRMAIIAPHHEAALLAIQGQFAAAERERDRELQRDVAEMGLWGDIAGGAADIAAAKIGA